MTRILLVLDDEESLPMYTIFLSQMCGYEMTHVSDYASAMACIQKESIQLVLFAPLKDGNDVDFARTVSTFNPRLPMIVIDLFCNNKYRHLIPNIDIEAAPPWDIELMKLRIRHALNPERFR